MLFFHDIFLVKPTDLVKSQTFKSESLKVKGKSRPPKKLVGTAIHLSESQSYDFLPFQASFGYLNVDFEFVFKHILSFLKNTKILDIKY
ncbi:hypothetical protein BpHYR1_026280 [Brachionus plicatilis]|uniref:Uncharacterized protein n=1 Tax=Brachionus plicatilis TaxID=10195 RepID=A0A3M7QVX1_BRAPC|nr:hypothetical protein BpHYR1_026280 [Brachionus plicatilis]